MIFMHTPIEGDFAAGVRTRVADNYLLGDFAAGTRKVTDSRALGDFATGMRVRPTADVTRGGFASGQRTGGTTVLSRVARSPRRTLNWGPTPLGEPSRP
jgi:hypothetical protein